MLYYVTPAKDTRLPVIASIPHSGHEIPRAIAWQFRRELKHKLYGTDWHLGSLYDFLPDLGVTVLQATHSRYVADLNRDFKKSVFGHHTESVVYRDAIGDEPLYDHDLPDHELNDRIIRYYLPYHRQLAELIDQHLDRFGKAVLLDLHSFGTENPDADVVLGDVNGKSCDKVLTSAFERAFRDHGFDVVRNERWTGGYITRHYSELEGVQALQIELRFRVYLEQAGVRPVEIEEKTAVFKEARERLQAVFTEALPSMVSR